MMPDYNPAEQRLIIDLLDELTGKKMSEIEAGLLFLSELEWEGHVFLGERDTLEAAWEAQKDCQAQLALVRQMIETFTPAIEAGYQEEGRWVQDPIGKKFALSLPHLEAIEAELARQLSRYCAYVEKVELKPKSDAFVTRVKFKAADAWARRGGQVNYGSEFQTFFTAVVKPIIGNKYTDNPGINFVTKFRKLRNLPPLRP